MATAVQQQTPTDVGGRLKVNQIDRVIANKTGSTLAIGALVYPSGYDATLARPTVTLADADDVTKQMAFVVVESIATNKIGKVAQYAEIAGLDTSLASAVGALVYLSATAGGWTLSAPTGAGQVVQVVGIVTAKDASAGRILFFPGMIVELPSTALQGLTATAAELSTLAASGITNADLVKLHAVTAAAAELNKVDGIGGPALAGPSGEYISRGYGSYTGSTTLDLSATFSNILAVTATLGVAPDMNANQVHVVIPTQTGGDAGKFSIYVTKPTALDNCTPIASSTATLVHYIVMGIPVA